MACNRNIIENLSNKRKRNREDLIMVDVLGSGNYGTVRSALHYDYNDRVAVKVINTSELGDEIKIHKQLFHPTIIQYYYDYSDRRRTYIVMEYGVCLRNIMDNSHGDIIATDMTTNVIMHMTLCMQYLKILPLVHRDIKPDNIILCGINNVPKLCDFGLSVRGHEAIGFTGTFDYIAPECHNGGSYTHYSDLWSLGITIYEIFHNKLPYYHINYKTTIKYITSGLSPTYDVQIPKHIRKFVEGLLVQDPVARKMVL